MCKFDARSCNHFCRGKAEIITYSQCVSVALVNPALKGHAPYYTVICSLPGSTIIFYIISLKIRFSEKKISQNVCLELFYKVDVRMTVHL